MRWCAKRGAAIVVLAVIAVGYLGFGCIALPAYEAPLSDAPSAPPPQEFDATDASAHAPPLQIHDIADAIAPVIGQTLSQASRAAEETPPGKAVNGILALVGTVATGIASVVALKQRGRAKASEAQARESNHEAIEQRDVAEQERDLVGIIVGAVEQIRQNNPVFREQFKATIEGLSKNAAGSRESLRAFVEAIKSGYAPPVVVDDSAAKPNTEAA